MVLIETMTATRPEFVRRSAGNTRSAIQAETGSEVGTKIGIGVSAHSAEETS